MFSWKNLMNLFNVFDLRVAFSYIRENLGTLLSVSTSFCCDLFHFCVELYLQSKSWLLTSDSKKKILKWAFFRQNLFCFVLFTLTLKKNNIKELRSYSVLLSYVYTCGSVVILFAIIVMELVNN